MPSLCTLSYSHDLFACLTRTSFSKVVDDIVYEVDCAMIVVKEGDVDIGLHFLG
jgi:hypothetical protein